MARVPKIDSPCPLPQQDLADIGSWCTHCATAIHVLDGLDDAGRRSLLAARGEPVCVSYRVRRRIAMTAALAAGLSMGAVMVEPVAAGDAPSTVEASDEGYETIFVIGGAVTDPANATWVDESELPDLPIVDERPMPGATSKGAASPFPLPVVPSALSKE